MGTNASIKVEPNEFSEEIISARVENTTEERKEALIQKMAEARSQRQGKLNFESNDHHVATSPDISMVQQPSDDNSDEE
jgi:hypothetical protein